MLRIVIGPNGQDFFTDAFYDQVNDEFGVDVVSWSSTRIELRNPTTATTTILEGSGFSNPEIALTGTLTRATFLQDTPNGRQQIAQLSGMTWAFEDFARAVEEDVTGNEVPLFDLLSAQAVTLDASSSGQPQDIIVDAKKSPAISDFSFIWSAR